MITEFIQLSRSELDRDFSLYQCLSCNEVVALGLAAGHARAVHENETSHITYNDNPGLVEPEFIQHIRSELARVEVTSKELESYLTMGWLFYGTLTEAPSTFISNLEKLLHQENLTELTDDLTEWTAIPEKIWGEVGGIYQSKRNPRAFSHAPTLNYWLMDEYQDNGDTRVLYPVKKMEK
jgi:hypothetical protein